MSVVAYPSQVVINRQPADDDELWWTIFGLWGYRIPRTPVCPGHVAPFTAVADAYFARHPVAIWKASRGLGGKSRSLGILGLTEATLLGCEVSILGGSSAQSLNVHDATKTAWAWHASPKNLLKKEPTQFYTNLTNEGFLRTLTASTRSARGPHPPRLRMDEIDEMDGDVLSSALGQPMEQMNWLGQVVPTQAVMSSTHQYPDQQMSIQIAEARRKGWPVFEWCYKETSNPIDGWLSKEGIARARSTVSQAMWDAEYDLQEPSFGGRAFDTDAVDRCFNPEWGTFIGEGEVFAPKVEGRYYVTAVDWAKHRDFTIVATFDTSERPWVCVAWHKVNKLPWPQLVKKALDQWRMYHDKFIHDATGVGDFVHDFIRAETTDSEWGKITGRVFPGGRERDAFYNDYVAAVEHDDIRYPRIKFAYDEHKYCTPEALFTSAEHTPDSVVVGALAWFTRKRAVTLAGPGGIARAKSPWEVA